MNQTLNLTDALEQIKAGTKIEVKELVFNYFTVGNIV